MRNPTPEEQAQVAAQFNGPKAGAASMQQSEAQKPVESVSWSQPGAQGAGGLPAPQARTVPAHEVSTVSPEAQAQFAGAGEEKRQAAKEAGGAEVGANQAQAGALQGLSTDMDRLNAEGAGKEDARRQAFDDHQAEVTRLRDEAASGKPDYGRWWRSKSGAEKAVGVIAMALGAAGAALSHTVNPAMEIINKAIDSDVSQQRDTLEQKGQRAKGAADDLRALRERFGDERAADAAFRATELEKYKLRGQAMVQQAQSPMLKAKWDGVIADIDGEQAKLYAQTHQYFQAGTTGGASSAVSDVKPEEVMQLGDGRYVTVPEKDREKVVAAQTTAESVGQAANSVRHLLQTPLLQRGPGWVKEYDAAQKTMAAAEIEGGGKGGKGLFEAFQAAQGGRAFGTTLTPGVDRAVARIETAAKERARSAIENSAQYEVRPQLVQNPKTGIVERKHVIVRPFERPKTMAAPKITPAGEGAP
jgi:hypothetical protein